MFHSPHAGHLPIHLGLSFPHSLQNHTLFVFTVAISSVCFGMHPVQFYYENARDTSHFRGIPSILPLFLLLMRRLNYSATTAESTVAVLSHLHGQSAHFVVSPQHSFCSASQHSAFFELLLQEHAAAADIAATTANVINTFFIITNN